jgi:hypothetical protein
MLKRAKNAEKGKKNFHKKYRTVRASKNATLYAEFNSVKKVPKKVNLNKL